ncbi:MAG TPA: alpha/beta fold hydrolase [Anaerolineae bacterium]|nr:alpha/beta fold hydrolase [Anaerolineae bacterium]
MFTIHYTRAKLFSLLLSVLLVATMMAGCSRPPAAPTSTPEIPTMTPTTELVATTVPEVPIAEPVSADAPALAGQWQGKIAIAGTALEIIVALAEQDGAWSGTIDVPAQGAAGIPLHDITVDGDVVRFEMLTGARLAVFDGQAQPDGSISGAFSQSGLDGTFELAQPQEPAAAEPLPYVEQEITFQNGDITLAGTLTLPQGGGPFPAVILLSGSGQQDRDEALAIVPGYRPFQEIADTLTRQGLAVLRYDDRGVGGSTAGDLAAVTSADFADDAEAAFDFLQGRADIDGQQIGFLGHSEGGILAPMVAARNPDVAFVITMAGTAVDGYETVIKQVERLALASGASPAEAAAAVEKQRAVLDLVLAQDWDGLEVMINTIIEEQIAAVPAEQIAAMGGKDAAVKQQVAAQLQALQSPWYQYFMSHDPGQDWAQITAPPVLGLFGGNDAQVDAEQNSAALQAALESAGNTDVTIQVLPTANHLFQDATTGGVEEYATLPPQLMPEFLEAISQWLLARVQLP